jgi:hypothetical protein
MGSDCEGLIVVWRNETASSLGAAFNPLNFNEFKRLLIRSPQFTRTLRKVNDKTTEGVPEWRNVGRGRIEAARYTVTYLTTVKLGSTMLMCSL